MEEVKTVIKNIKLQLEKSEFGDFLFYEIKNKDNIHINDLKLLRSRSIDSILPLQIICNKEETYIRYDLISEITANEYLKDKNSKDKLYWFLLELARSLKTIEKSTLKLSNVILNKEKIYIDTITNKLLLIYMPIATISDTQESISLKEFLTEVAFFNTYDDTDDTKFFVKVFNFIVGNDDITIEQLNRFIESLDYYLKPDFKHELEDKYILKENITSSKQVNYNEQNFEDNIESVKQIEKENEIKNEIDKPIEIIEINNIDDNTIEGHYSSKKVSNIDNSKIEIEEEINYKRVTRAEYDEEKNISEKINISKPTEINIIPNVDNSICIKIDNYDGDKIDNFIDNEMQTTALDESDNLNLKPYLFIKNINEKVIIDKEIFRLGRDKNNVDYNILSRAVGRQHALIIRKENDYYFKDNNSKNGSFINGNRVKANTEYKICHKDKLTLANEDMIFKLY